MKRRTFVLIAAGAVAAHAFGQTKGSPR